MRPANSILIQTLMTAQNDIIETWGDWTDEVVTARHRCPQNHHDDIGVLARAAGMSGPGWILAIMEIGTDEDVRNGSVPQAGDVERATAINISFCPFCGLLLEA